MFSKKPFGTWLQERTTHQMAQFVTFPANAVNFIAAKEAES